MSANFFAVRGSRQLSREEFESHLALAIKLENVALLLGAGASKSVGGMIMSDVWSLLKSDHAQEVDFLREQNFAPNDGQPNVEQILDMNRPGVAGGHSV